MNSPIYKPQSHLINIIKNTRDHHPNFVLMLGAGSSYSSGVKTTTQMIGDWRRSYHKMYCPSNITFDDFLNKEYWYNTPEEYSILFEKLYDQPSQRREYIETLVSKSNPSWGYIYLVNLLRMKVFNTVFTTNFDDLLNEACYQFSNEVRPLVCAHDSSIRSIRITSNRPKIIKLHGDYLFDNIKNTMRELESLEQNTVDKFKQYASEFGFVIIGYSGNDRSIMDTFNTLLKYDYNFPHGIYWCTIEGAPISKAVDLLRRHTKVSLITIKGFDEFFAELNSELSLQLQMEMRDPYQALVTRLNSLTDKISLKEDQEIHPIIKEDIFRLGESIKKIKGNISAAPSDNIINTENLPIPWGLLASINAREGNFESSIKFRLKEINESPNEKAIHEAFRVMVKGDLPQFKDELISLVEKNRFLIEKNPMMTFNISLELIKMKEYENADKILDFGYAIAQDSDTEYLITFYFLNKLQILKYKGIEFTEDQRTQLELLEKSSDNMTKMGAQILMDKPNEAIQTIKQLKDEGYNISSLVEWPIISFIRNEFDQLIKD